MRLIASYHRCCLVENRETGGQLASLKGDLARCLEFPFFERDNIDGLIARGRQHPVVFRFVIQAVPQAAKLPAV